MLFKVMLIIRSKVRCMMPNGFSSETSGDIRFIHQTDGQIVLRWRDGEIEFPASGEWHFEHHKLKSTNAKGRVFVLTLPDGVRIQISTKIDGISDHGRALITFFERAKDGSE